MEKNKTEIMSKVKSKYGHSLNYAKFLLSQGCSPGEVKNLVELAFPKTEEELENFVGSISGMDIEIPDELNDPQEILKKGKVSI